MQDWILKGFKSLYQLTVVVEVTKHILQQVLCYSFQLKNCRLQM